MGFESNPRYDFIFFKKRGHIIGKPGYSVIFSPIQGKNLLKIALVKTKKRIDYSNNFPPANAFIIVVSSKDVKKFQLHALMWLVQILENKAFNNKWTTAINSNELKRIIFSLWKS